MLSQSAKSNVIEEIKRGKELMNHPNTHLNPHSHKSCDLSREIIQSLSTALELLVPKETNLDAVATSANQSINCNLGLKRKYQRENGPSRKRRKEGDSKLMCMTPAPHCDGHQWRKYGQKPLSNSAHPRTYYRCTYKDDEGCLATKKIQLQSNEIYGDPPMFQVIYEHKHTCNSTSIDSKTGFHHDQSDFIIFESVRSSSLSTFQTNSIIVVEDQDDPNFLKLDTVNSFDELSCAPKVEKDILNYDYVREMNNFPMSPNWIPYYEYGLDYNPDLEVSPSSFV